MAAFSSELVGPDYRVLAHRPAADPADVRRMVRHFGSAPDDYLRLIVNGTEIELEHRSGQYVRVWGPGGCMELDEAYRIREQMPGAVPIGDDGGRILLYFLGDRGWGLYLAGWGNLGREDAVWVGPSLERLLRHGEGIENVSRG